MADWNPTIQSQLTATVGNAESIANTSLTLITNQAERAGMNLSGAQDQIDLAKQNVDTQLQLIDQATETANNAIDSIATRTQDIRKTIMKKHEQRNTLENSLETVRAVAEVREEQVSELKKKGEGNYHTSWLGLWRPLASESRFGLFVASIVLGLIGLLSIGFLLMEPVGKLLPAQFTRSQGFHSFTKK
jgi:multidrug efflux pump subunit AcrA (membrane-fusion protein)